MSYSRGSSLNDFLVEFDKFISDLKSVRSVIDKKEYITQLCTLSAMPREFSAVITSIDNINYVIILHTNPEGVSCDFVRNRPLAEEERLKKVESSENDRNFDSGNAFRGIGRRRIVNRNSNSNFGNFREAGDGHFGFGSPQHRRTGTGPSRSVANRGRGFSPWRRAGMQEESVERVDHEHTCVRSVPIGELVPM
ncbi:unnamed protein product [Nesidiocoris tenuis]|uniref:Uncharacterized protein n=1 Tax=Nesidiocoris tenuis TaxID=355587 RepID=A0A6H5HJJ7_9HEMI|nr:unnamed protein product [Nesidiocoris tenuis]